MLNVLDVVDVHFQQDGMDASLEQRLSWARGFVDVQSPWQESFSPIHAVLDQ